MTSPANFVASFDKRVAASIFDTLVTGFTYYVVVGLLWDATQRVEDNWSTYAAVTFVYHFGFLAAREGRTLGKQLQGICVVSASGQKLSLTQALVRASLRALPLVLLDAPAPLSNFTVPVVLAMLIAEALLVERSAARQSLADRAAGTLVVNLPPLQPHRAPAVPMYSAADAEFGVPPKANERPPRSEA